MYCRLVAFACDRSGFSAYERARKLGLALPPGLTVLRLPCAGKLDVIHLLKAIESNAAGVLVLACPPESCQDINGNLRAAKRVARAQDILAAAGLERERLRIAYCAAAMAPRLAEITWNMARDVADLAPATPTAARR